MKLLFLKKLLLPPYFLFVFYVVSCKLIGDHYPFARYDMYSTIPNYAYSFYITDENGVPLDSLFLNMRGLLSHQYPNICEKHNYLFYGYGRKTDEQLKVIGKEMLEATLSNAKNKEYLAPDALCLYRIHFFMDKGKMKKDEKLLFKKVLD